MTAVAAPRVSDMLGGGRVLGTRTRGEGDLRRKISAGLPYAALEALMKRSGLTRDEVSQVLRLPARTLARRKSEGKLSADESDRLARLGRILSEAIRILGDEENAVGWLREPILALGWVAPITLLDTDIGARQVEDVIAHIEFGMIS